MFVHLQVWRLAAVLQLIAIRSLLISLSALLVAAEWCRLALAVELGQGNLGRNARYTCRRFVVVI